MYRRPKSSSSNAPFKAPRMSIPSLQNSNKIQPSNANSEESKPLDEINKNIPKSSIQPLKRVIHQTKHESLKRTKLQEVTQSPTHDSSVLRYFEVVWRKPSGKKNKTWDGDGIIILSPTSVSLRLDESNNYKERSRTNVPSKFTTDGVFSMGGLEIESMGEITSEEQIENIREVTKAGSVKSEPIVIRKSAPSPPKVKTTISKEPVRHPSTTPLINRQFKKVLPLTDPGNTPKKGEPLYPNTENAISMNKRTPADVDVVIDPFIAKLLRPHQVKGVKFLYECVMGLRGDYVSGALLADDMGLGKTLQTITLIWTLLKQSPSGFESPAFSKVLIACPVTLVGNWKREFKKWLPMNRINVLTLYSKNTAARDKQDLRNFAKTRVYQVLIMGYEKILNMKEELALSNFDLLVCDEGHRLKNNSNKTLHALNSLEIEKKILLSGTPIQNDLTEFFNIADFINPGILGTFNQFKRNYVNPILKSRELNCTNPEIAQAGEEKSLELISLTKPFILRRTASVISDHLPPRTDIVLFCSPTHQQINLFNEVLGSYVFNKLLQSATSAAGSLGLITMFKKICNSPSLVSNDQTFQKITEKSVIGQSTSGKLQVLVELLGEISRNNEKVVIVSNYTQTLDILQSVLQRLNLTYSRLDGSTPSKDRDSLVNQFNKSDPRANFAFLLSSKSGGVGLNLIGASRLILFDNDWNPSIDLQAMARIHRDGQKKPVFIYRLITTGCIDEKIFQRQLMKSKLSDKFLDEKAESDDNVFNMNDLKDLFTLQIQTKCNTHDLIECDCDGKGEDLGKDDDKSSDDEPDSPVIKEEPPEKKSGWVSALAIRQKSEDDETEKKGAMKNVLADFKHIDPSHIDKESDVSVGDEITENVVIRNRKLISYILTKVNKLAI